MNNRTKSASIIGVFSAVAFVLSLLGNLIPLNFAGFLNYDPKDVLIVIAGFMLGPIYALAISVITAFIEMITISQTGFIGLFMNIISSVSFACIASLIYKKIRSIRGAVLGLVISSLVTTALMLLWNYITVPLYMVGVTRAQVADMLLPVFLPFNLIKCTLNSSIAMLLYKPLTRAIRRARLVPSEKEAEGGGKFNPFVFGISIFIAISAVFLLIILK